MPNHWRLRSPLLAAAVGCGAALAAVAPATAGRALGVTMDGVFGEWGGAAPTVADTAGDGRAGGVDLGRLWLANDANALYLRLEVGAETILANGALEPAGNNLRLYLDLDDSPASGRPEQGLGVDLEIRFGERQAVAYDGGGSARQTGLGGAGVIALPTHSSAVFEIRVPFSAAGNQALAERLAGGARLTLLLEEETAGGDRLPDGGAIAYVTSSSPVRAVKPKKLAKKNAKRLIRLFGMNVERTNIAARQEVYTRLLQALEPDIIAFQEIYNWSAERTRSFVAEALPLPRGRRWSVAAVADTVVVSSFPIVAMAGVDANGVALIDLPDERTAHDLVLFNAHTPCCQNDAGRDAEHDAIAATWRDLLAGTGPFTIQPKDAVVMTGDFNMVGFKRQLEVLRDGVFIDPAQGENFRPGRAKGSLKTAALRHSHARTAHTWRRSSSAYGPGRLDWILFSSDVAKLKKSFVLDTESLPDALLESLGLERSDSRDASDHLALVADFRFKKK